MAAFTVARLPDRLIPSIPRREKVDVLLGPDGKTILSFFGVPNSVNTISVTNAPTGTGPTIAAAGETNTNLNLVAPGTGVVKADGDEVVTLTGTQTLTNKTLTSPKIAVIADVNGNTSLGLAAVASAVNSVNFSNAATGGSPFIRPAGSDTNINMSLVGRGTGGIRLQDTNFVSVFTTAGVASAVNFLAATNAATGAPAKLSATGTDTDVGLNLATKGAGLVQANGVPVVTTTDIQTLTGKTLTTPKIATILDANGNNIFDMSPTASAVNYIQIKNAATAGSVAIRSIGSDANIDINFQPQGTGTARLNGVILATTTNTQTLSGKTITSLKLTSGNAPASATAAGVTGQIEWASGFVYICVATNTWQRAAIATW